MSHDTAKQAAALAGFKVEVAKQVIAKKAELEESLSTAEMRKLGVSTDMAETIQGLLMMQAVSNFSLGLQLQLLTSTIIAIAAPDKQSEVRERMMALGTVIDDATRGLIDNLDLG